MILLLFFIISFLFCGLIFVFRNKAVTRILVISYAVMHIALTVYSFININTTELVYFTFTSTGVLLLAVLSVLVIPVIYHGFIYASSG